MDWDFGNRENEAFQAAPSEGGLEKLDRRTARASLEAALEEGGVHVFADDPVKFVHRVEQLAVGMIDGNEYRKLDATSSDDRPAGYQSCR